MTRPLSSLLLLGACVLLAACSGGEAPQTQAPRPLPVIPAPAKVGIGRGAFTVTAKTPVRFATSSQEESAARYFIETLQRTSGLALAPAVEPRSSEPEIVFQLQAREGDQVGEEA